MTQRILFFFAGLFLLNNVFAQQSPLYNQYYINPLVYNPAMLGVNNQPTIYLMRRTQWSKFPGSPETNGATFDAYLKPLKLGFGLGAFSEKTDIYSRTGANLGVSARVNINNDTKLLFGLSGGLQQNKLDYGKVIVNDTSEAFLSSKPAAKALFDANFGVYLITKLVKVGLSMPQMIETRAKYPTDATQNTSYKLARNYMINAKYVHKIDKKTSFYPLLMVRYVAGAPIQYDANFVYDSQRWGWVAVCYKSNYAVVLNAGIKVKGITLGYAYDIGFSRINKHNGMSSEIILGYTYTPPKKEEFRELPKY
jgi:type IX secretion system PorP/SprF family membrane protein